MTPYLIPINHSLGDAMANDKIKTANWAIARARWEHQPSCSYSDLTDFLDVSKQAIAKRAAKDGWRKKVNLAAIMHKAHAAADSKISGEATLPSKQPVMVDDLPRHKTVVVAAFPNGKDATPEMLAQAVEDVAVDARAQILVRHRNEWTAVRNQLYKALKVGDSDGAKLAKMTSEIMKLMQDGERKAWGIDAGGDDKPTRIVIERTEGIRVVR